MAGEQTGTASAGVARASREEEHRISRLSRGKTAPFDAIVMYRCGGKADEAIADKLRSYRAPMGMTDLSCREGCLEGDDCEGNPSMVSTLTFEP